MRFVRKNIGSTPRRDHWAKARIGSGSPTNGSEYTRDPIRPDRERTVAFATLQAAIREGLSSGISDRTIPQIIEEAKARFRQNRDPCAQVGNGRHSGRVAGIVAQQRRWASPVPASDSSSNDRPDLQT